MTIFLVTLALLGALSMAPSEAAVVTSNVNGNILIQSDQSHYALTNPSLISAGMQCASVNADTLTYYLPGSCELVTKSVASLTPAERILVSATGSSSSGLAKTGGFYGNFAQFNSFASSSSFSSSSSSSSGSALNSDSFTQSGTDLPGGVATVAKNGKIITFVYLDGRVLMKPVSCMDAQDKEVLRLIEKSIKENQEKFKNQMEFFENQMNSQMRHMQDQMSNMNSQLDNMFGNMFGRFR